MNFILGAMFLIMFALKLAGVIGWSWWIVTLPITAPLALFVLLLLALNIASRNLSRNTAALLESLERSRRRP